MKTKLVQISQGKIKDFIEIGFRDDPELLSTYHISPGTLVHCVDHNYKTVVDSNESAEYYKVISDGQPIGFTVIMRKPVPLLLSFGINIQYRKKEILQGWLHELSDLFRDPFVVTLWPKNIRAIHFFLKNGFNFSLSNKIVVLWQS